ncbi:MAG: hypothetical protein QGF90_18775 [Gammaproteobacteria bacterium]|jgi:hypothetical protein|nr:hypothetical protein [Gammaproteobacteria bacterium]
MTRVRYNIFYMHCIIIDSSKRDTCHCSISVGILYDTRTALTAGGGGSVVVAE